MGIDYSDRGVFHKVVNHTKFKPNKSKRRIIRYTAKAALKVETTALFAKDIVTNRLVGKEFHIRFDRQQNAKGKARTRISLVRVNSPAYRQPGILHRAASFGRRFEGDTPKFSVQSRLSALQPKTKAEKAALFVVSGVDKTRRAAMTGVKKAALSSETAVMTIGNAAGRRLYYNARNDADAIDTGKAVLSAGVVIYGLNRARKATVEHHLQRKAKKEYKISHKAEKRKYKKVKADYKLIKKDNKQYLKRKTAQLQKIHKVYKGKSRLHGLKKVRRWYKTNKTLASAFNKREAKQQLENKIRKNQRKVKRKTKKLKRYNSPSPLFITYAKMALPALGLKATELMSREAQDNDFVTAITKIAYTRQYSKGIRQSVKSHKVHKTEKKLEKLNKRENKLEKRKVKLQQNQGKNKQKGRKNKKKAPKKKGSIKNLVIDFVKFIFKMLGTLAAPLLIFILIFALLLLMFGGTTENSSWVLGTYNCNDSTMTQAINKYTQIAYEFNENVIKCQNSSGSNWRAGLHALGADTDGMDDTPTRFIFGRNYYQNYDPVYDFDVEKFMGFMCALAYDFDVDSEDIELWEYKSGYDDIIQELFDEEYKFEYKYVNNSYWKNLSSYTVYPSSTEWWFAESSGTIIVDGTKYGYIEFSGGTPSELQSFARDNTVHFSLSSSTTSGFKGEVRNRNDHYKKTGFFIQDLDLQYTSPSGNKVKNFYTTVVSPSSGTRYMGFQTAFDDEWHHKTQLMVGSYEFNYAIAADDVRVFLNDNSETRQLVRDFRAEEYVTECSLYTNVKRTRTFDEAIRYILNQQTHASERIDYYEALTNPQLDMHGNHQMFRSPLETDFSSLVSNGKIYNDYGYDMQKWGSKHCSREKHDGLDIVAASGTKIYSMIDGKVESINADQHTITVVTTSAIDYWYDDDTSRHTKIIYTNVTAKSGLHSGDTVNAGDLIGKVDTYKYCYDDSAGYPITNPDATKNYLHLSVQIKYGTSWRTVDPRFLIYPQNG